MLRTQAKAFTNIHNIPPQIKSINVGGSFTWWQKSCSNKDKILDIKNNCLKDHTVVEVKINYIARPIADIILICDKLLITL